MKRTPPRPAAAAARSAAPPPGSPPTPLGHPAMIAALVAAAACVVISVTFTLWDTDLWHHLLVGRVIWQEHAVPTRQLWSWPTYGAPDANSAWLFRALVWPLWSAAEVPGLFVWRWAAALAAFTLVAATARRMGARGFAPIVVLVLAVLLYRLRSQLRPETLAAVLLALEMLVLERRRQAWRAGASPGRGPAIALVAIAWIWANTHPSWYLGFVLLGAWWTDEWLAARAGRGAADRAAAPRPGVLLGVIAAAAAISFVNPFGWRALWLPFDFFLHLRHELMYRTIKELGPVDWRLYARTALPLLVAGWPLLILWRARRGQVDRVELALCLVLTPMALTAMRFILFYVVAVAPFLMRDLSGWTAARRWPRWTAPAWTRAAITIVACVGAGWLEWNRPGPPLGIGMQWDKFPVAAADYIERQGIRGRGFNNFEYGAYQAWRFWPDRGRLPFMTGTPEVATREDRLLYAGVFARPEAWRVLDAKYRFDYILIDRVQTGDNHLLDRLDADTTWALVFADDAAAVYLRRDGPHARLAADSAYRLVPGGTGRLNALGAAVTRDPAIRARTIEELERQVASSRWSAHALGLLANVALVERRYDEARALLGRALAIDPALGRGHERLGLIALEQGRPRGALAEFERERALNPHLERLALRMGQAYQALGDTRRARDWYRRELAADPGNAEARDSLAALERGGTP